LRHHRGRADLERRAEALRNDAARLGVKVDTVLDLQSEIADRERELAAMRDEERAQESALERVTADFTAQSERLNEQRQRMAAIDAEIAAFKSSTRAATLEEYQAVIDRRRAAESDAHARRGILQGLVPVETKGAEAIAEWRAAIDDALSGTDPDETGPDPERAAKVDAEIREIDTRESDARNRLSKGGKQIYGAQMKAAELHAVDDVPRCRTVHDLEHLAERIAEFCRRIEHEQALAQDAVRVFQEIDAAERERVGDLFGPAAQVSATFRDITGGRYRAVTYDVEADQVFVERADGKVIRATALSGGAYDQLYLAIRLSIADRLLGTSRGFFIMDDPFIKADSQRLAQLIDTLRRIVRDGWQVLYFSAKQEVLDALSPDIAAGTTRLIELNRTLFSPSVFDRSETARP
jgi:uncharacterized protein YhaN